jgi:hypothetical protein
MHRFKYPNQTSLYWSHKLQLPTFVEQELANISSELSPVELSIEELLSHQQEYNKKAVRIEGSVQTVISIDQTDEATVATWFFEIVPTTVKTTASATYFYLENTSEDKILVKYPADLDISAKDNVAITGFFSAHAVTIETKGLLRTSRKEVLSSLGEPFLTALLVENKARQKIEYIRK